MHLISSLQELDHTLSQWRASGESIALVPTMGNLHTGHLALVTEAKAHANRVVVSIFVNPTQFGPGEDFANYPRTLTEDQHKLIKSGADALFMPDMASIYPEGACTSITVNGLSEKLCGAFRPGHFSGVATIVAKLFNLVQPQWALFGEKDFQQLAIIRKMTDDLNFPVAILSVATVRESDGLAMSSRNSYLNSTERSQAAYLYQSLCEAKQIILKGVDDFRRLENNFFNQLQAAGFVPDYFSICRHHDLEPASADTKQIVILVAARLGKTRLIDNIYFSLS